MRRSGFLGRRSCAGLFGAHPVDQLGMHSRLPCRVRTQSGRAGWGPRWHAFVGVSQNGDRSGDGALNAE